MQGTFGLRPHKKVTFSQFRFPHFKYFSSSYGSKVAVMVNLTLFGVSRLIATIFIRLHFFQALLDLLDQVEDVISVEDCPSGLQEVKLSKAVDTIIENKPISIQPEVTELRKSKEEAPLVSFSPCFLVLEVICIIVY